MNTKTDKEKNNMETQSGIWKEAVGNLKGLAGKETEINKSLGQKQSHINDLKDIPNVKKEENRRSI